MLTRSNHNSETRWSLHRCRWIVCAPCQKTTCHDLTPHVCVISTYISGSVSLMFLAAFLVCKSLVFGLTHLDHHFIVCLYLGVWFFGSASLFDCFMDSTPLDSYFLVKISQPFIHYPSSCRTDHMKWGIWSKSTYVCLYITPEIPRGHIGAYLYSIILPLYEFQRPHNFMVTYTRGCSVKWLLENDSAK